VNYLCIISFATRKPKKGYLKERAKELKEERGPAKTTFLHSSFPQLLPKKVGKNYRGESITYAESAAARKATNKIHCAVEKRKKPNPDCKKKSSREKKPVHRVSGSALVGRRVGEWVKLGPR